MLAELIQRRFPASQAHSEATVGTRTTTKLSLAIASVETEFAEITRSGRLFHGYGVAAGAAPIQAIPTTTATHFLWNGDKKRSYVIVNLYGMILSGTPGTGCTIWTGVFSITTTLPAAATGAVVGNGNGGGLSSKAIFATAYTIATPTGNNQWHMCPGQEAQLSNGTAVASVGGLYTADVRGRLVVPPQMGLGIVFLSGVGTTPLFIPGCSWYEAEEDIE
jgi:hypothetical protein